jgi:IS5 family transposase
VVDRNGTPLAAVLSQANTNDSRMLAFALEAIAPSRKPRGRPRRRPLRLHGDKAYDHRFCRDDCRRRHVAPRFARRGLDTSRKLGRHRWVVERTLAWLNRFRRLTIRYDRRVDIHQAFLTLARALICFQQLQRFC